MLIKRSHMYCVLLYVSALGITPLYALHDETTQTEDSPAVFQSLLNRVLKQINAIDYALEQMAQAINTNAITVHDKKSAKEYITTLRTFITKVRKGELCPLNKANLEMLLEINKTLLAHLTEAITNNIQKTAVFNEHAIIYHVKSIPAGEYTTQNSLSFKDRLDQYDQELAKIHKGLSTMGVSFTTGAIKAFEKFDKDWDLTAITKRLLPYVGLGVYYIFTTSERALPQNGFISAVKQALGGLPKKQTLIKPRPVAPGSESVPAPVAGEAIDDNNAARVLAQEIRAIRNDLNTRQIIEVDDYVPVDGLFGTPIAVLSKFINVDTKPFFTFSAGAILAPTMKRDAEELSQWGLKQAKKLYAYLKGEPFDDGSPIKKSKLLFKDIIGHSHAKQELSKVINYFKKKDEFDRAGAFVDRGYLLVGQLDSGKLLAQALSGEISQQLKELGKKDVCGFYEIHASLLLTKSLKDIVKEAEKESPCIIIIDELDWLSTQKQVEPSIWSDIVNSMSGTLKSPKKQIFIIATVQNIASIDSALKDQKRLGVTLHLSNISAQERKAFFTKELTDRTVDSTQFDIDYLAQQTQNCSTQQLAAIIKRAVAHAQVAQEIIAQKHIETSIDEIIHGIVTQPVTIKPAETKMLAAHYAGKALAHIALKPNSVLTKVTILPVGNKHSVKPGALITYKSENQEFFTTDSDIEKECIIELSGLAAQKILLNTVSASFAAESKKHVFNHVKALILEGIAEIELPKGTKEQKLAQAWQLVQEYAQKAQELITKEQDKLVRIANALEQKSTLNAQELTVL